MSLELSPLYNPLVGNLLQLNCFHESSGPALGSITKLSWLPVFCLGFFFFWVGQWWGELARWLKPCWFPHCLFDLQEIHTSLVNQIIGVTSLSLSTFPPYSNDHREYFQQAHQKIPNQEQQYQSLLANPPIFMSSSLRDPSLGGEGKMHSTQSLG